MPQLTRMYCSNCGTSIYNTFVGPDGQRAMEGSPGAVRVPLVLYFVVGQAADTGAPLEFNAPGVCIPAFIRAILLPHVHTKRVELCMVCVADLFGVPSVEASADDMYSATQERLLSQAVTTVVDNPEIDEVATNVEMMQNVFNCLRVGRGVMAAPALPPDPVVETVQPSPSPVT